MTNDIKKKKKTLKQLYKSKKKKYKLSSGKTPWTKIISVSVIIIAVVIVVSIISWYNMPSPNVDMIEKDEIYADFNGSSVSIKYLKTYFNLLPKLISVEPIITDYFPSQYSPTFSSSTIYHYTSSNNIQFIPPLISRNSALSWEYTLNATDLSLNTWFLNPSLQLSSNQIPNNTETTLNISASFKASRNLDQCMINLGFLYTLNDQNSSVSITPITPGYTTFSSGFFYQKTVSTLSQSSTLSLDFQINITLNSSQPLDILNSSLLNNYGYIQIQMNNYLINNFYTSGFSESTVEFTGLDNPPSLTKFKSFGINLQFTNITISPI